jgi:outer membrane autotransporter protein
MWINGTSFRGDQDSEVSFAGYEYSSQSIVGGIDFKLEERFIAGLSVGYTGSDLDVDYDRGAGDIGSTFASLYTGYFSGQFYLDGIFSYGRHEYDNMRNLVAFSTPLQTTSSHRGDSWSLYGESGYNFTFSNWNLQPFASLQYIYLDESGFETAGADALNIVMKSRNTDSLVSDLGGRLNAAFKMPIGIIVPEISASWNYDFGIDDNQLSASFAGYRDASFTIKGRGEEQNMLKMSAGVTYYGRSGFSSSLKYIDGLQDGYRSQGIIGELRIDF